MRNIARSLVIAAALAAFPGWALAQGEIFKIETSGLEHCADFDSFKFGPRNNQDLWVKIVDAQEWDLAPAPDFPVDTTIAIIGRTYFVTQKKVAFTGVQLLADNSFIAIDATAPLDAMNVVKKASGTFIQDAGDTTPCISSGKWKTVNRLFP